ncbi:AsnC family transcriptional regulator [Stella humosa]|uniref:AsnC family transcriptional regulator n=1 Tax=Stella humosa TaxID=94 RepID=A0A3N1KTP3_9PROT|nr:Lrp/AsnC family transcriptional regulator [Stella humosa]ROP83961.1 AsnC family transcriptional regulator [Stella humosa]BBK33469.1 AsnC family transcriptional regulator [Stella humosa]
MIDATTIDPTDEALLRLLRQDARLPTAELGRRLGVSRTTVQSRLERLERRGVIAGYTVRLGREAAGALVRAHILLTVAPKLARPTEAALARIPQIAALHSVSGIYDLIAVVEARSVEELDRLIDEIGALDGVERTVTSIILSTRLDRG